MVRSLDELWRRRIVREQEGGTAYDFSHDKIRTVAYAPWARSAAGITTCGSRGLSERSSADDRSEVSAQDRRPLRAGGRRERGRRLVPAGRRLCAAAARQRRGGPAARTGQAGAAHPADVAACATSGSWICSPLCLRRWLRWRVTLSPRLVGVHDRAISWPRRSAANPARRCCGRWRSPVWFARISPAPSGSQADMRDRGERDGRRRADRRGHMPAGPRERSGRRTSGPRDASSTWRSSATATDQRAEHLLRYGQDPEVVALARLGQHAVVPRRSGRGRAGPATPPCLAPARSVSR